MYATKILQLTSFPKTDEDLYRNYTCMCKYLVVQVKAIEQLGLVAHILLQFSYTVDLLGLVLWLMIVVF